MSLPYAATPSMAFPPNDLDMPVNNSVIDQVSSNNTRLNPAFLPRATSVAGQNTNVHQPPFYDPKLADLAAALQYDIDSETANHSAYSINPLFDAIKTRGRHPELGIRLLRLLDTFAHDPKDRTTVPADQRLRSLYSNYRKALEHIRRQEEAMNQLRHERDQRRTKADSLEAFVQQRDLELSHAVREIQRLSRTVRDLQTTVSGFFEQANDSAPRMLSSEEVIRRYGRHPQMTSFSPTSYRTQGAHPMHSPSPWTQPEMPQPGQTPQHYGLIPNHQTVRFHQQGFVTPPSSNPSPLTDLATPHHQLNHLNGRSDMAIPPYGVATQPIPFNAIEGRSGVSIHLTNSKTINQISNGKASPCTNPSQQERTAEVGNASNNLPSGSGSKDAGEGPTILPKTSNNPMPANHPGSMHDDNSQAQPHPPLQIPQHDQTPPTEVPTDNAAVVEQPARRKRSLDWVQNGTPTPEMQWPQKRAKTTDATDREQAPKKTPAKKAAPKTTEPRRKAPGGGKTRKDKDLEAKSWTPNLIHIQEAQLKEAADRLAANREAADKEAADKEAADRAAVANVPVVEAPENVEEDDDEDQVIKDLLEEWNKQNS
ncbi:MAG: hypothetical protein Q9168_002090 [Polycauliona sp. 1 TL-2023]